MTLSSEDVSDGFILMVRTEPHGIVYVSASRSFSVEWDDTGTAKVVAWENGVLSMDGVCTDDPWIVIKNCPSDNILRDCDVYNDLRSALDSLRASMGLA
ncbi:MAG: hypothetical protein WC565_09410 [Parcubacteria group bacterium]